LPGMRLAGLLRRRNAPDGLQSRCRPSSRGEAGETTGPSRKVRTPKGRVVGVPTRGNPRESATETNRLSAGRTRPEAAGSAGCEGSVSSGAGKVEKVR
jgi:hypothetical protein